MVPKFPDLILISFHDKTILYLFLKTRNFRTPKFCYLAQRGKIKNKVM